MAAEAEATIIERDPRLMEGEEVIFKTEKHWLAPITDSLKGALLIIGALVLAWLQTDQTTGIVGFGNRVLNLFEIVLMLGGIGSIVYNIIAWKSASYVVTNHRILCEDGLLRKRSADTLLTSLSDVRMRQSAPGRSLGYGDIQILSSSGDAGADMFTTVKAADEFKKQILQQKLNEPAPPAAAPFAATPVAAPSAQAEAVATLNQLASLRDSGAITPEEFAAKKQELLSRI